MTLKFIKDEVSIGQELGITIDAPLRVFDLEGWGIDTEKFLNYFTDAFEGIPWDIYHFRQEQMFFLQDKLPQEEIKYTQLYEDYYAGNVEISALQHFVDMLGEEDRKEFDGILPDRKRTLSRFVMEYANKGKWYIEVKENEPFKQEVDKDDVRKVLRKFSVPRMSITHNHLLIELLEKIGTLVLSLNPNARKLDITFHTMGVVTYPGMPGTNSPEGTHQDGADYIISALVVGRHAIKGGVSTVYGPDKKTVYLETTLMPGQGLFQADKGTPLWHNVSSVYLDEEVDPKMGYRNIFGFDINIVKTDATLR